jgi:hypothetical protein
MTGGRWPDDAVSVSATIAVAVSAPARSRVVAAIISRAPSEDRDFMTHHTSKSGFAWPVLIAMLVCVAVAPRIGTLIAARTAQPEYPEAEISNGQIRARLYLPDARRGFYRSTRFDWSGVIASLEFQGHQYYGPWFTRSDPSVRDFIYKGTDIVVSAQSGVVGPAEEFPRPQGYTTAKPGGTFVKIGVGVLRKPDESTYSAYNTYEIVDSGKWTVKSTADSVEFVQELTDAASGFGYLYRKTVRLASGRPELVIDHSLQNTGRLPLQTTQYNHNFLVLDRAGTGPDFTISFPFQIQPARPHDPALAEVRGNRIVYVKTLEGEGRVSLGIQGFGKEAKDYDFRIESRKLGAGIRMTSDRPLASVALWSIRSVISLEPFVDVTTEPGKATTWRYSYTYYSIPK